MAQDANVHPKCITHAHPKCATESAFAPSPNSGIGHPLFRHVVPQGKRGSDLRFLRFSRRSCTLANPLFPATMRPVALATNGDGVSVAGESAQSSIGQKIILKHLSPFLESSVAGYDHRPTLIPPADDLIQILELLACEMSHPAGRSPSPTTSASGVSAAKDDSSSRCLLPAKKLFAGTGKLVSLRWQLRDRFWNGVFIRPGVQYPLYALVGGVFEVQSPTAGRFQTLAPHLLFQTQDGLHRLEPVQRMVSQQCFHHSARRWPYALLSDSTPGCAPDMRLSLRDSARSWCATPQASGSGDGWLPVLARGTPSQPAPQWGHKGSIPHICTAPSSSPCRWRCGSQDTLSPALSPAT